MKNPLLLISATDSPLPFDIIKDEHFEPAFTETISIAQNRLKEISGSPQEPSFANTIEALEFFKEELDQISLIFFNYTGARTNDYLQKLAKEVSPKLAALANDVFLDEKLFARVKIINERCENLGLSLEERELLQKTFRAFRRNGALLSTEKKEKLREIDRELSHLSHSFSDNLLKATNDYELVIQDQQQLQGISTNYLEEAKAQAEEKGYKDSWLFSLRAPSYVPFLKFADRADLRKKLWMAFHQRCLKDPTDNREILKKISHLRWERAQLLGFAHHAEFTLEERMASNTEAVKNFLDRLIDASLPAAKRDIEELQLYKEKLGHGSDFFPWDVAYYSEKLKAEKFHFNEEELRSYFELDRVLNGVFTLANRLFRIRFEAATEIPTYHPDVKAYRVVDENTEELLGFFYADFFTRESKRGGAWMTNYRDQGTWKGERLRPQVAIVCNFAKPTSTRPTLLTLIEVRTLFHEFGHALHGLLSQCKFTSLSGANVYWDFVELPSQIMENWTFEKEMLSLFAEHYETKEKLSNEWMEKIKRVNLYQAGYMSARQLMLGLIDLSWHALDPRSITDVVLHERDSIGRTRLFPHVSDTCISTSFSHIFSGGYAAGYYSYKWAEVLDADAFEHFKQNGIFNAQVGESFRKNILERGATEHPMTLYKRFRGREPDPNALLRRDALI